MKARSIRVVVALVIASLFILPSTALADGSFSSAAVYNSTYRVSTQATVYYAANPSCYLDIRVTKVTGTWKCYGTTRNSVTKASYGAYEAGDVGGYYNPGQWWWTAYSTSLTRTVYSTYTQYRGTGYFSLPWVNTASSIVETLGGSAKGLVYYDSTKNPAVLSASGYYGGPW